jgi:hypothetical protein
MVEREPRNGSIGGAVADWWSEQVSIDQGHVRVDLTSDVQHFGGEVDPNRTTAARHEIRRDLPRAAAKVEDQCGRREHVDSVFEHGAIDRTVDEIVAESTRIPISDAFVHMPNGAGVEAHSKWSHAVSL